MPRLDLILTALLASSCSDAGGRGFTPQPQPVPNPAADFALSAIRLEAAPGGTRIAGEAGAVHPPGSELRIFDLDAPTIQWSGTIEDDGSFDATVAGAPSDAYRMYAVQLAPYGSQLDVVAGADGVALELVELGCGPLAEPQLGIQGSVGRETTRTLALENRCDAPLSIAWQAVGRGALSVDPLPLPLELAPGQTASLTVRFAPDDPATSFDILQLGVEQASRGRVSVTLIGVASPP